MPHALEQPCDRRPAKTGPHSATEGHMGFGHGAAREQGQLGHGAEVQRGVQHWSGGRPKVAAPDLNHVTTSGGQLIDGCAGHGSHGRHTGVAVAGVQGAHAVN